ncbi:MAG: tetratricopeptide repeat protein [Planctomycetota bacterium]|nr:tetratricopeptide repeat protein [Planctomycetota bacterium]
MLESYALAIVDFSDYVAKNKDDEKGWYWRARARFGFGEAEQALNDLDRALELNELYAPALVLKGDIQAARNQYQAAIKMYTKALEIYIFDLDVVLKRIECFMKVHDYERAVKDCSEILAKFPDYYQAYYLRSSAYKALLQLDKAEADINKGLTLDPDKQNSLAMFSRAMCRMLQGKFDGAVADLRTAAFVDSPDRAAYSLHFCIALGASGRPQDVRAEYELAKKNLPAIVGEEDSTSAGRYCSLHCRRGGQAGPRSGGNQ